MRLIMYETRFANFRRFAPWVTAVISLLATIATFQLCGPWALAVLPFVLIGTLLVMYVTGLFYVRSVAATDERIKDALHREFYGGENC